MKFLFGKIGVCIAAAVLLASCELLNDKKEKPDPPAIPGKIVFSMPDDTESENYQIYVMNADGSDLKKLTHFENDGAAQPSWSPDGEQIVFSTSLNSTSEGMSLYIMNADGSNPHPMKERPNTNVPVLGSNARWSPDGTKIAYDFCINCNAFGKNSEIFIYDFETDSVMQVTEHPAGDTSPAWSSDGQQLAFVSHRDYYNADTLRYRSDLYSFNIDNNNLQRLTETGRAAIPQWHPSNSFIAYEWNIRGNKAYLIDLNSKEISEIESNLEFEASPQWSISGTHLILLGRQNEGALTEIQLFHFKNNQPSFAKKIDDNPFLVKGRNFDWYYNENN